MTSLQSKLRNFGAGLAEVTGQSTYHFFRPQLDPPFTIWAEDGEEGAFEANNHKQEQLIHGTIDYFTQEEFDPVVDEIQDYLNAIDGCGWILISVQYEEGTNTQHYEWGWTL